MTQALSLLLAANATDRSLDGNEVSEEGPLALGEECMLPEERIPEGLAGYTTLQNMEGSNTDSIRLAVAYYAYALGRPSECLSILAEAKDLTDVQSYIPGSGRPRSGSLTLQVPSGGAVASSASSWTGSFAAIPAVPPSPDIGDGRAWATVECIRSICLQVIGMSHERISPSEPQSALDAYLRAIPLLKVISTEIPCTIASGITSGTVELGSFVRYRELWRWVERLLRRAIILSAKFVDLSVPSDDPKSIWSLFDYYRACSAHWPPTFRPDHRSTILVLHLRALILRANGSTSSYLKMKIPRWISTARSIIQEYRAILSINTHFPRAGERNTKVEDFVDMCVAVWEADGAVGEYAGWVIDVLWWATRLTFNSHRVFRHMARLLYVAGDPELSKRILRLYIQVVSKAREAGLAEPEDVRENDYFGIGADIDSDRNWVFTLIHGARMLCRLALQESDYGKALDEAKEAGVMIEKAKTRLDTEDKGLVAIVDLTEGVWSSVMAQTEHEPLARNAHLAHSLERLLSAVGTYPAPSIYHHLALALCRPGPSHNLQDAIVYARSAVEGDASEIRHWHLLGLLLTATGDWRAAKAVLEFGIDVAEGDLRDDDGNPQPVAEQTNGTVNIRDFATVSSRSSNYVETSRQTNGHANGATERLGTVLSPDVTSIPPSAELLQPPIDRPPSTRHERFEYALQTRMTLLALCEYVQGAEGVGDKWLEVFQWFREKRGVNVDDRRRSIDSRRISGDTRPPSEVLSMQQNQPSTFAMPQSPVELSPVQQTQQSELPTPIPITITPASPGLSGPEFPHSASLQDRLSSPIEDGTREKRSSSLDEKDRDVSRGKKVKDVLKTGVHKSQARISTISKKIGHGVHRRSSLNLKRSSSAPDFQTALSHAPYQASSIHLRQYQSIHASQQDLGLLEVPPPPPSPTPSDGRKRSSRAAKDSRLLSDLWLMSAATFRRLGKIEQAKGAIQEAEVRDEENPAVWVQLGLYYTALNDERKAIEAFRKALFIEPDHVSATVHLCRLLLSPLPDMTTSTKERQPDRANVDLAAGLLSDLTQGMGWDVPEVWYFLAKAYKLQDRRDRERECLSFALSLSESRGVRDIGLALGWCL
ncbi:unnamed protein product [Somion occarium]|uniref:TPR-like protein n=1 Tax=Somion occarium TaxID=3059160 RepID=A0ABP1D410_9APHY